MGVKAAQLEYLSLWLLREHCPRFMAMYTYHAYMSLYI